MHWRSKLIHPTASVPSGFQSLAAPVHRGSTIVFPSHAAIVNSWRHTEDGFSYGLSGTPTTLELGARVAELEGARHSFVVPGGQAAISLIYLSYCRAGGHVLLPKSAYGPNKDIASGLMRRINVEVEQYDPMIGGDISRLIRPDTCLIWTESPGSVTMEVQDVPAIVKAAHAADVPVALDNTYAAGVLFDAFAFGVDVSMQALTKYVSGHGDVLLGTVSVANEDGYERVGSTWTELGMAASPDDASLTLRGLQTMGVRLKQLEASTLEVAKWLKQQSGIELVLHPALPDCEGHENWKRDFTGAASLFSIIFEKACGPNDLERFVDALRLFKIGYGWAGTTSLVMTYSNFNRPGLDYAGRLVRLNIGLEEPSDLIADLSQALDLMKQGRMS
jgi:cysteine-S-conjugate beta-lyase